MRKPREGCAVQGCDRPVTGELKLETRSYPVCRLHGEVLEDRLYSLAGDPRVVQEASEELRAMRRGPFRCGDLVVDFARRTVTLAGKEVALTPTEYYLLSYLAQNAGYVLTADEMLRNLWGQGFRGDIRSVQVKLSRVRQKVGDDARNPRYIFTRPGLGYYMRVQ